MTVLYRLDADAAAIAATFGAHPGKDPWKGGYVAPGSFAPIVTAGREFVAGPRPAGRALQTRIAPRLWGVPPPATAGTIDPDRGVLTVRNCDSPFWIGNLRNSEFRCLVPATAFMVWGEGEPASSGRPRHWFAVSDQAIFALAGVWKDSEVPSFAILTCEANARLRQVGRDVMPVVLPPSGGARQTWLHADWERAKRLIAPYGSGMMREMAATPSDRAGP